jgi:hypothetical protein
VPDRDTSRSGGELVPLRPRINDGEIGLEPARLEPLTAAQEAEAVELLAALLAAAARRRVGALPLKKAA